jgi:putative flippase GtrA
VNKTITSLAGQRWFRFIVGGGINTGFTYIAYICFNFFLNYQASYLIAYALGVVFSYWLNARFVFCVSVSWRGLFSYPIVYVVQYALSALILAGLVDQFKISESIAPLLVVGLTIPVTYIMSKFLINDKSYRNFTNDGAPK